MKGHTIEFQILQTRVYKVNFFQNIQQLKVLKVSSSIFNSTTLQDSSYGDLEPLNLIWPLV